MKGSLKKLQEKKKGIRNANGITLVALVVTIVILLILAGVTIATLTGDNGIIKKAQEAREQTDLAGIREEIALIWNEVQIEIAGKGYTSQEIADILEEKLQESDPDASVTYQGTNNTYEVDYKDHMFEVQPSGDLTSNREEVIEDVKDALENIDKDATGEDKAEQIQEELNKKDPDSTAEYNPETGNVDITHGGYEAEVDEDGNITITGPEVDKNVNITAQPSSVTVKEGEEATFEVEVTGAGEISYQWYKSETNSTTEGEIIAGETNSTYTIDEVTLEDNNTYYYCVITQKYGSETKEVTTNAAKLTVTRVVEAPEVTSPNDVSVIEGVTDVTFEVEATGEGSITYQWYKSATNSTTEGTPIQNETNSTYTIPKEQVTTDLNGSYYYVEVTQNYEGDIQTVKSEAAALNVTAKSKMEVNPKPVTAFENDKDVTFEVIVTGEGEITYQWYKSEANSTTEGTPIEGEESNTYTIPKEEVTTDLNGSYYYVIVTQKYGTSTTTITSEAAMLTVEKAPELTIIQEPEAVETISNTEDVSFNVVATGVESEEAKITYQWYYNTTGSTSEGTPIEDATSSTYTISKEDVTAGISGRYYYCVVKQEYRGKTNTETTQAAKLTVISPVEITAAPTSVQAIEGQNDVTFTVTASGNGNLSYQWFYKTSLEGVETPVSGANTATYTIDKEDVTSDLNGRYYYAKITQSYGSSIATATSSEALLTVAEKANIIQEPASVTVTKGSDATFEVAATGTGELTYQWYKSATNSTTSGTPIQDETNSTYTINNVAEEDNETYYYCVITQKYGSSTATITSSVAKLTVGDGVSVSNPNDVNAIAGETDVTFEVTASGSGTFSYQWYSNTTDSNQNGTQINGANDRSYTIPKEEVTTGLNRTYYYVEVTQNYGGSSNKIVSEAASLSVIAKTTISVNPQPVSAYENGQNVIFSVTTEGEGSITYQWYKNDTNSNQGGEEITGAVGNTYTIPKENVTTDLNETYYYVVVTQKYGSTTTTITSEPAKLTVTGTSINASETDVTVYVNGNPKTVTLSGDNAGTFSVLTPSIETTARAEINPENNSELIITPVSEGKTSVVVQEGNGGKTIKIDIEVKGTTIEATPESVIAYVNGNDQTVTLGGDNTEGFMIETNPDGTVATANIVGNTLTITPLGKGTTKVVVKETNGNKTKEIPIEVKETTINASEKDVIVYVNGNPKTVTLSGENTEAFEIETNPDDKLATASIEGNVLTIEAKSAGSTSVVVKETNGNQTTEINIEVKGTTVEATPESVIAYVDGDEQKVTLGGENAGTFSIVTEPETYATAEINPENNHELIITPVSEGTTSVVVKEANGNKTLEIPIEVKETKIEATSQQVTAYVGGTEQKVTITGTNIGELSIETGPDDRYATARINESNKNEIIITPVAEGETSITIKEANGKKTIRIDIIVVQSSITATDTNVTAYVGGANKEVTIEGTDIGSLSITKEPTKGVATAELNGNKLTITPEGAGDTSIEVTESNGNNTVTINVAVLATSITPQSVEVYAGGSSKQFNIEGLNMGTLTIEDGPDTTYASASVEGTTLTVTPTQTAGNTELLLKEANGNQTATISITVTETSLTASKQDVTVYVGGKSAQVTISGQNEGTLSLVQPVDETYAGIVLNEGVLTISPKAEGSTSVEVQEANGNKKVRINITVKTTSINAEPESVIAYVGGEDKTVTITGTEMGELSVSELDTDVATVDLQKSGEENILTIHPVGVGKTSVTVTEGNGNKYVTINMEVKETSIKATPESVIAYVGGIDQQVKITGTEMGELSVSEPTTSVATVSLQKVGEENILTIHPVGEGSTSVIVTEENGNQKVTIDIEVKTTEIEADNQNVEVYVNGNSKTVNLSGTNAGTFSVLTPSTETIATAEINSQNNNELIITPVAKGETSVVVKEANGNKEITINIDVKETTIEATQQTVIAYVGGTDKQVTFSGDNAGTFSLVQPVDETYADITLSGNTLTVKPKAVGSTSVKVREANGNKEISITIDIKETTIDANYEDVTVYVGGGSQTVNITGDNIGDITATTEPEGVVETSIDNEAKTVTITPVGEGTTTITIKEANGGKEITINVEVKTVTIAPSTGSVTLYVGGNPQTVEVTGQNYGTLSIIQEPTSGVATAQVGSNNDTIIITPQGEGDTEVKVREANTNKEFTISIKVVQSTIQAEHTTVTAYVGGENKTVKISGTGMGNLSISNNTEASVAEGTIDDETDTLTIKPLTSGNTSITVTESNGNKTVTIQVTVLSTNITPQTVQLYAGGTQKEVTIQGQNMGTLTIESGPDGAYASASIEGTTLTITPTQTAGNTELTLKEANGGKTGKITINVLATSIEANPTSVTANVSDGDQTVTLSGTNAGTFSIVTQPNEAVATASISGSTLTITPVGGGETSVTVKEANGNKQTTINITISAGIEAPNIPATDYGATVKGYDCENSAGVNSWKIFYADESNIYLIADDYIHYDYCPPSKNYTIYRNSDYRLSMNNVYRDYTGSASITDERIKALNNDYFNVKGYTSTYTNMRAVAYMLDTEVWSVYAGEKAEYAIGGPTVEMLMASYSEKYGVDYRAQASSRTGYQISNNGGASWSNNISGMLSTSDSTYVINSTSKAYGMWVASPSADYTNIVMNVGYNGNVNFGSYANYNPGFRPLVCLRSDITLQENSDGSYTIN